MVLFKQPFDIDDKGLRRKEWADETEKNKKTKEVEKNVL